MKKAAFRIVLTVLVLTLLATAAYAEGGKITYTEWKDQLLSLQAFTFKQHKNGIGLGDCPVYTAPSKKALRLANNRQAVDTDQELYEAGKTEDGWLLVRYDNGKYIRTGYIPADKVKTFKSDFSLRGKFGNVSAAAAGPIQVTDDPIKGKNIFATIGEGEHFTILAKYTYKNVNWWYIECTTEGKTARGFIDRSTSALAPGADVEDYENQMPVTLETLGTPSISPMNTAQAGEIIVNGNKGDERKNVRSDADANSKQLTVVYPARTYPYYAEKTGTNGSTWYYIFVEEDTKWGWVAGNLVTVVP